MIPDLANWVKSHSSILYTALCLALVGWSAYNVGLRQGIAQAPNAPSPSPFVSLRPQAALISGGGAIQTRRDTSDPRVVTSKSSTSKKYHYLWCSSANRIKEANKVYFATKEAAEAAGYTLAGNCQ
jgi:hypothetical protein